MNRIASSRKAKNGECDPTIFAQHYQGGQLAMAQLCTDKSSIPFIHTEFSSTVQEEKTARLSPNSCRMAVGGGGVAAKQITWPIHGEKRVPISSGERMGRMDVEEVEFEAQRSQQTPLLKTDMTSSRLWFRCSSWNDRRLRSVSRRGLCRALLFIGGPGPLRVGDNSPFSDFLTSSSYSRRQKRAR